MTALRAATRMGREGCFIYRLVLLLEMCVCIFSFPEDVVLSSPMGEPYMDSGRRVTLPPMSGWLVIFCEQLKSSAALLKDDRYRRGGHEIYFCLRQRCWMGRNVVGSLLRVVFHERAMSAKSLGLHLRLYCI